MGKKINNEDEGEKVKRGKGLKNASLSYKLKNILRGGGLTTLPAPPAANLLVGKKINLKRGEEGGVGGK